MQLAYQLLQGLVDQSLQVKEIKMEITQKKNKASHYCTVFSVITVTNPLFVLRCFSIWQSHHLGSVEKTPCRHTMFKNVTFGSFWTRSSICPFTLIELPRCQRARAGIWSPCRGQAKRRWGSPCSGRRVQHVGNECKRAQHLTQESLCLVFILEKSGV